MYTSAVSLPVSSRIMLTMATPNGLHVECVTMQNSPAAIGLAIIRFANSHGIAASMVDYMVSGEQ